MDAETLEALKGSIAKWEAIVAGTGVDKGPDNCPLCQRFWRASNCIGCPVFEATGLINCGGTPYEDYERAYDDDDREARDVAAREELDFLKSLLPSDSNEVQP